MKRIILIFAALFCIVRTSCTKQQVTRQFGGKMEIKLPAGQELMEVTWKDNDLFYLTRPMAPDYIPVTKTFQESSSWGVMESTVLFIEAR